MIVVYFRINGTNFTLKPQIWKFGRAANRNCQKEESIFLKSGEKIREKSIFAEQ